MKWENATLISLNEIGKDELSNPIYENKEIDTIKARFQPWTNQDVNLDGRDVTLNQRKLILRMKKSKLPHFDLIKLGDETYTITTIKGVDRFTALYVKTYKL